MIMKLKFIKNKQLRRFSDHAIYLAITLLIVPGLFFEICIVLPTLMEQWSLQYFCHLACSSFLFFNFIGNMIYGMITNTTVKCKNLEGFNKEKWTLCSVCECLRPPRAWHCDICEICVLNRDHHCRFLACCVGYFNHRYFMMCTFYMFIGMMYSLFFNIEYVSPFITWNHGYLLIKLTCPLLTYFLGFFFDFGDDSLYLFLLLANSLVGLGMGFLFAYHLNNLLKGRLCPEKKSYSNDFIHNKGWKLNVIEVFGSRWYLTWISPLIRSELPGNAIESPVENKSKIC